MPFTPDSEIQVHEILFRAIHPSFWNYDEDRPTSALFKDRRGVSVDRDGERTLEECISFLLYNRERFGACNIQAGLAKNIGAFIKPDSQPDNKFHAMILESESKINLSNGKAKELSRAVTILFKPTLE